MNDPCEIRLIHRDLKLSIPRSTTYFFRDSSSLKAAVLGMIDFTVSTGHADVRTTRSATLPSTTCWIPVLTVRAHDDNVMMLFIRELHDLMRGISFRHHDA
jgi:hypothetical protein